MNSVGTIKWLKWTDPFDDDDDDDDYEGINNKAGRKRPVLVGPEGALSFHEKTCVSRYYNFWVGHTDFKIMDCDAEAIEQVNGVESLNVPTRHRFRIAVGQNFDEQKVMDAIDAIFKPKARDNSAMSVIVDSLKAKWPFWAIIKGADGRISSVCGKSRGEVSSKLSDITNEEVIHSWD